jgi:23S rRNA (pseudouridine1915-N3)-methyltransferase
MKIKIYAIGKMKNDVWKEGANEYLTRLKPYADVQIIELNDEPVRDNPSDKEIEMVKNKEGQKVLKLLKPSDYLISLDLDKKELKSPDFADCAMMAIYGINYCLNTSITKPSEYTAYVEGEFEPFE